MAALAERGERRGGVPTEVGRGVEPHLVGAGERRRERVSMDAHAHGVGTRLEHREDARRAHPATQPVDGRGDRGRVMRKVVVDAHPASLAAQLHAPGNAAEAAQRLDRPRRRHPGVARSGDRRQRILDIVRADQPPLDGAVHAPVLQHLEAREVRGAGHRPRRPQRRGAVRRAGKALERRPAAHGERLRQARVAGVPDDAAAAGDDAYQVMELPLDGADVGVDVGVIVLEIVEDQRARPVVHELGALVEERAVVFVGLDDEERRGTQARAHAEVLGHATDQEPGVQPRVLEDPGQERRGRRLAVGARDREHPAVLEYLARQPFRTGDVRQRAVEQRLDHRLAARHDVADHHDIGGRVELRGLVACEHLDAELLELRAHRRVELAVGAGDAMAGGARNGGDPAHESAADAKDVQVHGTAQPGGPAGNTASTSSWPTAICRITSATLAAVDHSSAALTT